MALAHHADRGRLKTVLLNRHLSVKVKYPAIFLLATAIPIAVLGFFAYRMSRDILRTEIFTAERVAGSNVAKLIQAHVDGARRAVAEVSVRPGLRAAVERRDYEFVNRVFRGLTGADSDFRSFFLLGPTGVVLAAESRDPALVAGAVGLDRSQRDYFRRVLEDKAPYVSDIFIPASGNPAVVIAAPMLGPGGEVLAVVGGGLSLTRIQGMIREVAESVSAMGILVDRHGILIAHPKSELVTRRESVAASPEVQEALAGRSGTREVWKSRDPDHQLVSYQPVPGLGWAVVIASPVAEAYAPITRLHGTLLAIAGLGLGAAVVVAVAIGFGIARPLDHLASATRRFGEGDRAARTTIDRRDEIGEVARAFNGMASRVSALEEERTRYAERLKLLHEIDHAIITAAEPVAIAEAVLPRLRDLLGVPRAIVNLFDLEAGEAEWLAAVGRRRISLGPVRFPLTLMGDVEALRRGELQVIDTTALPPIPAAEALLASGVLTYMVVPMIARGELIGAVSFGGAAREFPLEQVGIAQEVAAQLAIALAQARLHERVKRQAEELEAAVEDRTRDLDRQRTHLEAVLAGMGEGVCVIDTDGRVLVWNRAAERIRRVSASAMVGTIFPGPLPLVHGDLVLSDFSQTLMKRALDTGEPVSTTSPVTRPDGTEIEIAITAAPVRDAAGAIFGCVNVFRDITREREVDRMKSQFVSAVSHELRTPLTSIRAYAETLRDMVGDDQTVQEFLAVIEEESLRLTRLINDLLNLSRIESGRVQFKQETVALEPLVRRVVQMAQPKAAASDVRVGTEIAADLPPFRGDADAIQQVLTNLVDNGVKYNRPGGGVLVRAWLNGGLGVEIVDTGLGMPEAAVHRLGERFFRVDSSETRRVGGTGLGVTLVMEILAAHGARLEVKSEEGQGSAFRFVLPLAGGGT